MLRARERKGRSAQTSSSPSIAVCWEQSVGRACKDVQVILSPGIASTACPPSPGGSSVYLIKLVHPLPCEEHKSL